MNTEETGLPRTFRSPWRWVGIAIGVVMMIVGISGFAVVSRVRWSSQSSSSWSGCRAERRLWIDVASVKIVPGHSVLPSRTVVLVDRNGGEDLTLTSLSWYPIRSHEPRRVARFIQTANTFIKPWTGTRCGGAGAG